MLQATKFQFKFRQLWMFKVLKTEIFSKSGYGWCQFPFSNFSTLRIFFYDQASFWWTKCSTLTSSLRNTINNKHDSLSVWCIWRRLVRRRFFNSFSWKLAGDYSFNVLILEVLYPGLHALLSWRTISLSLPLSVCLLVTLWWPAPTRII